VQHGQPTVTGVRGDASPTGILGDGQYRQKPRHIASRPTAALPEATMRCVFSIDVEDWFHLLIPSYADPAGWDSLPSRVEWNFMPLLDLLATANARCTCFFLGYIGLRFPRLVREAASRGHEIASHGYAHRLACEQSAEQFYEDVRLSRTILEDAAGGPVI